MICCNELYALKCNKRQILLDFVVVLSPFAPFICEELWHRAGNETSILDAPWPAYKEEYLKEDTFRCAVAFNGKVRFDMEFAAGDSSEHIEKTVLESEQAQKYLEGKTVKKVIVVPRKMVNVVC
jgi:leucyl-tRNA synthetase